MSVMLVTSLTRSAAFGCAAAIGDARHGSRYVNPISRGVAAGQTGEQNQDQSVKQEREYQRGGVAEAKVFE